MQPYCEEDHTKLFMEKCALCMKPITSTSITAVGRAYHPEHLYCSSCGIELRYKVFFHYNLLLLFLIICM